MDTKKEAKLIWASIILLIIIIILGGVIIHLEHQTTHPLNQKATERQEYLEYKEEFAKLQDYVEPDTLLGSIFSGLSGPPRPKTFEEFQKNKPNELERLSVARGNRTDYVVGMICLGIVAFGIFAIFVTALFSEAIDNLIFASIATVSGIVTYKGAKAVAKKLPPKAIELGLLAGGTYVAAKGIKAYRRKERRQKYGD